MAWRVIVWALLALFSGEALRAGGGFSLEGLLGGDATGYERAVASLQGAVDYLPALVPFRVLQEQNLFRFIDNIPQNRHRITGEAPSAGERGKIGLIESI